MNNIATVISLVRSLINDDEVDGQDIIVYSGTGDLFSLSETNVNSIDTVLVNDTESGVTYTEILPKIRITSDLIIDDVIEINYKCYSNYSDNEIKAYIKSALVHLSSSNIKEFTYDSIDLYPTPTSKEVNLIALLAATIINPTNISYRMPDVSITSPDKLSTFDKIQKILSIYKKSNDSDVMFVAEDWTIAQI